jgi:hypothetical protein
MPMLTCSAKLRAASPSRVKIATPLPYSCLLTISTALYLRVGSLPGVGD